MSQSVSPCEWFGLSVYYYNYLTDYYYHFMGDELTNFNLLLAQISFTACLRSVIRSDDLVCYGQVPQSIRKSIPRLSPLASLQGTQLPSQFWAPIQNVTVRFTSLHSSPAINLLRKIRPFSFDPPAPQQLDFSV